MAMAAMTFDEVSMERSKSFVKALQELKNLRPQLYSAAEYCEKSYLHSEQKQTVLDNLKDYAVRALVNAVDHLGTVAYKLTDLFDQQAADVSTLELKATCLNQQILMCQSFVDKEGLKQQQMSGPAPKLHKHYILPYSGKMQGGFGQHVKPDLREDSSDRQPKPYQSVKTLSWHLASETKSASNGALQSSQDSREHKTSKITNETFRLPGNEKVAAPMPLSRHLLSSSGNQSPDSVKQSIGLKDNSQMGKQLVLYNPNVGRREIQRVPVRTKNVLSAFFVKNKSSKLKKISVP